MQATSEAPRTRAITSSPAVGALAIAACDPKYLDARELLQYAIAVILHVRVPASQHAVAVKSPSLRNSKVTSESQFLCPSPHSPMCRSLFKIICDAFDAHKDPRVQLSGLSRCRLARQFDYGKPKLIDALDYFEKSSEADGLSDVTVSMEVITA